MSTLSSLTAYPPVARATGKKPGSRAARYPQRLPQMHAEDVARTLVRLQMRIRELEAELTALKAVPAGWL